MPFPVAKDTGRRLQVTHFLPFREVSLTGMTVSFKPKRGQTTSASVGDIEGMVVALPPKVQYSSAFANPKELNGVAELGEGSPGRGLRPATTADNLPLRI